MRACASSSAKRVRARIRRTANTAATIAAAAMASMAAGGLDAVPGSGDRDAAVGDNGLDGDESAGRPCEHDRECPPDALGRAGDKSDFARKIE